VRVVSVTPVREVAGQRGAERADANHRQHRRLG
jgi:hypothetical protein